VLLINSAFFTLENKQMNSVKLNNSQFDIVQINTELKQAHISTWVFIFGGFVIHFHLSFFQLKAYDFFAMLDCRDRLSVTRVSYTIRYNIVYLTCSKKADV